MGFLSALKKYYFGNESKSSSVRTSSVSSCPNAVPYVILDTETTGLNASTDHIIQLSAIKYGTDGTPVDFFNTYLNPGCPIPARVSQIHGITDKTVAHAPTAQQIQDRFLSFLGDALIVGYNVTFDLRFLYHTFGDTFSGWQYVDVLSMARQLLWCPDYKLETVSAEVNFSPSGSFHDSFTDCEAVAAILNHIGDSLDVWSNEFQYPQSQDTSYSYTPTFTYPKGYKDWSHGEDARINGDFEEALRLFAKAQDAGFIEPALYESYAKLYRKQRDFEHEILVLEEAITHFDGSIADDFDARKKKAQDLLLSKQKKEDELLQKQLKREQKAEAKRRKEELKKSEPKQSCKRSVVQYSDDGTIVKVFESVSAAAKEVGVDSKGIRNAACGRQKHAGGFCWKYSDQDTD